MIELFNGEISLESEEGNGTICTFTVRFELASMLLPQTGVLAALFEETPSDNAILVVDDNPMNRTVVHRQLTRLGFHRIEFATNGAEAVVAFKRTSSRFQTILMDCEMPVLDGYDAAKQIREFESDRGTRIPIVAITASASQSDRDRCFSAGMDDYLT